MSSLRGRPSNNTEDNLQAAVRRATLPSLELCEQLRSAVKVAAARDAESVEALHRAVCAFTVALRDSGTPPEGVLIALKSLVGMGTLPPLSRNHPDWAGYLLREKMSTWCVNEYFREEKSPAQLR